MEQHKGSAPETITPITPIQTIIDYTSRVVWAPQEAPAPSNLQNTNAMYRLCAGHVGILSILPADTRSTEEKKAPYKHQRRTNALVIQLHCHRSTARGSCEHCSVCLAWVRRKTHHRHRTNADAREPKLSKKLVYRVCSYIRFFPICMVWLFFQHVIFCCCCTLLLLN